MLRRYLLVARRHIWIPVLTVVLAVGAALVYEVKVTPIYESTTTVRVLDEGQGTVLNQGRVDPARAVAIEALYAASPVVKAEAEKQLGPKAGLVTDTKFTGLTTTDAIGLHAYSTEKQVALAAAQAYARAYIDSRRAAVAQPLAAQVAKYRADLDQVQGTITSLDGRISALSARPTPDPTGRLFVPPESPEQRELTSQRELAVARSNELNKTISDLDTEAANRQAVLDIIEPAELPDTPVRPSPKRDLAIAFTLGVFLGAALVMLRERFDKRIVTLEQLKEGAPAVPVIVSIPAYRRKRRERKDANLIALDKPEASATDAYRALRGALLVGDDDQPIRSLLFTGAMPDEGKTTTTANLGVVLAMAGSRVLFVDCDLRRPMLKDPFKVADSDGLAAVVEDRATFDQVVRRYPLAAPGQLDILPCGQSAANPAELLQSDGVKDVLDTAYRNYDFVLVDSPPVLAASDALILAPLVDGVVVVTRSSATRAEDFAHVVQLLNDLSASIVSVVLNRDHGRGHLPEPYYSRGYGRGLRRRGGRHGLGRLRRLEPTQRRPSVAHGNGASRQGPAGRLSGRQAPIWPEDRLTRKTP